jgi:hypothetical protein
MNKKIVWILVLLTLPLAFAGIESTPVNNTIFSYYSDIPINWNSTSDGVNVYVSNESSFTGDDLICSYGSGILTGQCLFTAIKTDYLSSNLKSHYKFGDSGTALTFDSGTDPKSSATNYGVVQEDNCGMIQSCSEYNGNTDRLDYGDVRDALLSKNADWTLNVAGKKRNTGTTNQLFHKNDDSPSMQVTTGDNFNIAIYFNTACSPRTITTLEDIETDKWYFYTLTHDATANTFSSYLNGIFVGTITDTCYNPGSSERIGGEGASGRSWDGVIDEFLMLNMTLGSEDLNQMYIYKQGVYYFKINNSVGDSITGYFIKDLSNPIIKTNINDRKILNGFSYTVNASDLTNVSMNVSLDGVLVYNVSKNNTFQEFNDEIDLEKGLHNLSVVSIDSAGLSSTLFREFYVYNKSLNLELKSNSPSVSLFLMGLYERIIWRIKA